MFVQPVTWATRSAGQAAQGAGSLAEAFLGTDDTDIDVLKSEILRRKLEEQRNRAMQEHSNTVLRDILSRRKQQSATGSLTQSLRH